MWLSCEGKEFVNRERRLKSLESYGHVRERLLFDLYGNSNFIEEIVNDMIPLTFIFL